MISETVPIGKCLRVLFNVESWSSRSRIIEGYIIGYTSVLCFCSMLLILFFKTLDLSLSASLGLDFLLTVDAFRILLDLLLLIGDLLATAWRKSENFF